MAEIIHKASVAVFSSLVCLLWERPLNTVYKCWCAVSYRAIFRYSSAKVAKTAEMYVFTRRKYCTKILENIYAISFCTTLEKILLLTTAFEARRSVAR